MYMAKYSNKCLYSSFVKFILNNTVVIKGFSFHSSKITFNLLEQTASTGTVHWNKPAFTSYDINTIRFKIVVEMENSKNYRSDETMKSSNSIHFHFQSYSPTLFQYYTIPILYNTFSIFQSSNLPILHCSNLTLFQSHTLPILHSSDLKLFQSSTLSKPHPSNPTLFQFYTLPIQFYTFQILHSINITLLQSYTLPMLHSSNLTLFPFYIPLLILHASNSTLPILHSSNLTLFQFYTLPILHSSNLTLFHSYTFPIEH